MRVGAILTLVGANFLTLVVRFRFLSVLNAKTIEDV